MLVTIVIKLLQFMRQSNASRSQTKSNRIKQATSKTSPCSQSLDINQQYCHLLKQLAKIAFNQDKSSEKARLFQTAHLLKQIKQCLRKESNNYNKSTESKLSNFIGQKKLGNAGNLIGKYQQLNDQIEYCKRRLEEAQVNSSQGQVCQLSAKEKQLQKQLEQTANKRIQLQNRQEVIRQQLDICRGDLRKGKGALYQDQLKLRGLESVKAKN